MAQRQITTRRAALCRFENPQSPAGYIVAALVGVLLAFAALPASGADLVTEERDVSGFSGVSFSGSGELNITQTGTEALAIEAEPAVLEVLITEVRDGVLHIRRKRGSYVRTRHPVRFDLTVADLSSLAIHGSGDTRTGRLSSGDFSVTVNGSGDVSIDALDARDVDLKISGSGDLRIHELNGAALRSRISGSGEIAASGLVTTQSVKINGSGDLLAGELKSSTVDISVHGSGDVDVWATEELEANLTGSGDVRYLGNPMVSSRVTGSGEVTHRDMMR